MPVMLEDPSIFRRLARWAEAMAFYLELMQRDYKPAEQPILNEALENYYRARRAFERFLLECEHDPARQSWIKRINARLSGLQKEFPEFRMDGSITVILSRFVDPDAIHPERLKKPVEFYNELGQFAEVCRQLEQNIGHDMQRAVEEALQPFKDLFF